MSKRYPEWNEKFAPAYTPLEMIQQGVFEGTYVRAIRDLPKSWYKQEKVVGSGEAGDPGLNKFGVTSRLSLRAWQEKGWIRTDPGGWFEWYCRYFLGRRLGEEDDWQIARWVSFVARHQGQIVKAGVLKDESKRMRQRQGLLQWAWDSTKPFDNVRRRYNQKRLSQLPQVNIS